jgi:hypothetical protein
VGPFQKCVALGEKRFLGIGSLVNLCRKLLLGWEVGHLRHYWITHATSFFDPKFADPPE